MMAAHELVELAWTQAWQLTALVVVIWSAARWLAKDRPHLAHALWLVVLLKCVTPPVWSSPTGVFSWLQWEPAVAERLRPRAAIPEHGGSQSDITLAIEPRAPTEANSHDSAPPAKGDERQRANPDSVPAPSVRVNRWTLLIAVWLGGAVLCFATAAARLARFARRLSRCPHDGDTALAACVGRLSRQLGVRRRVRVLVTHRRIGPAVIGLLRPTIVLPSAITEGKTPAELEPLIAHELVHVRRGDLFWAAVQTVATSLWWFHPLVWTASRMMTREAERSCDEEVIASLACEPAVYARGLLDVLERKHRLRSAPALPGVRAVDITSSRLERIMRLGQGSHRRTPWWCWMLVVVTGAIALPGARLMWAKEDEATTRAVNYPMAPEVRESDVPATSPFPEMLPVSDLLQDLAEKEDLEVEEAGSTLVSLLSHGAVSDLPAEMEEQSIEITVPSGKQVRKIALGGENSRMQIVDGMLYVFDSSERRRQIHASVERLRKHGFAQVVVTTRFVSAQEGEFEKFGVRWSVAQSTIGRPGEAGLADIVSPVGDDTPPANSHSFSKNQWVTATTIVETGSPVLYSVLDPQQSQRLLEWAQANARTNVIQAPRVTVFNGQSVDITDLTQRPFVTGITRVPREDGELSDVLQPIVRVVEEGTRLRLRPVLGEEDRVNLGCSVTFSNVRDVHTVAIPQGAESDPPKIQVPEVASTTIASALDIPLGSTLAISGHRPLSAGDNDKTLMLLITCEKISPVADRAAHVAPPRASKFVSFPNEVLKSNSMEAGATGHTNYFRIPIEAPVVPLNTAESTDAPTDEQLIEALLRSGQVTDAERKVVEESAGSIRIVKEKLANYHDAVREESDGQWLQKHHRHYKCPFILPVDAASDRQKADADPDSSAADATRYVLYIDHHHNHLVSK